MTSGRSGELDAGEAATPALSDRPRVSVVVSTYNRADQVGKAIESVLSQSGVDLELVVVDDGSTDDTPTVLAGMGDPRMRWLQQGNGGLSRSRNLGAREARGEWLLFLDDDDRLREGALKALLAAAGDESCRVVLGGVRFVDSDGQMLWDQTPRSLDDALAGSFLIRRTLYHEAGGYLEGMPCSHQTELFLRVRQVLGDCVGAASYVAEPVVEIEKRPTAGRPQRSPANEYFGARWLVARHQDQYTYGPSLATIETIAAVNAMRIGRKADARRRFASAVRHDPRSPERYLRLLAAIVSPIGRRIWLRQWDNSPQTQRSLDRVRQPAEGDGSGGMPALERDPEPGPDTLFMPWRYRENPSVSPHDEPSPRQGRAPTYKWTALLARAKGVGPIVDIGCVEGDLDDEAVWEQIRCLKPQLVFCSGLVERAQDPRRLLSGIRHAVRAGGKALISTPDRGRLGPDEAMGPPSNSRHIREWSAEEFALLLESCGFEIIRKLHRLPWRPSMVFIVQAARDDPRSGS